MAEVLLAYLGAPATRSSGRADGTEAAQSWQRYAPDVVILDIMLPGLSGLEVLRRRRHSRGPRRGDHPVGSRRGGGPTGRVRDRGRRLRRQAVLAAGGGAAGRGPAAADRAVGRSPAAQPDQRSATCTVDSAARTASRQGRTLALTTREFDLLAFLAAHPGETFGKEELLRRVWGWDFGDTSTVTVHVRRLREKIEHDPSDPQVVLDRGSVGLPRSAATGSPMNDFVIIVGLTVATCVAIGWSGPGCCTWSAADRCATS